MVKEFNLIEETRQELLDLIKTPTETTVSIADVLTIVQRKQGEFVKKTVEDFNNVTFTIEDIEIRFKKRAGEKLR